MSTWIFFEPVGPLFFRGNRPFTAGVDTFAEPIFPSPLALYGAISDYILKKEGVSLKEFLQGKKSAILGCYDEALRKTKMKLKGPFLYYDNSIYFFPPANIFITARGAGVYYPDLGRKVKWDIAYEGLHPLLITQPDAGPLEHLLSAKKLGVYLKKDPKKESILKSGDKSRENIWQAEPRFGHKLDGKTLTVAEGFLYRVQFMRFAEVLQEKKFRRAGLIVQVEGIDVNYIGEEITFVGGERRMARIVKKDEIQLPDKIEPSEFSGRFFFYLATPAIFDRGWYSSNFQTHFCGANLVGAAVQKPIYLSGWKRDAVASGKPRPLKRAVPAGSVYFFQMTEPDPDKFKDIYNKFNFNNSVSDEFPAAGFGIGFIGIW